MRDDGNTQPLAFSHETLIGLATAHAIVLLQIDVQTRDFVFRHGQRPGLGLAFFGLLIAALLVVPGALIGWHLRGKSLSLRPWLGVVVPYWLAVAFLSSFICFIPNAANAVSLLYGVLAVMFLAAGNAQEQTRRRPRRTFARNPLDVPARTFAQERSAPQPRSVQEN